MLRSFNHSKTSQLKASEKQRVRGEGKEEFFQERRRVPNSRSELWVFFPGEGSYPRENSYPARHRASSPKHQMTGLGKANSAADSKEKSAILGADFGNDFLSFWGPSKKGKDKMDFDVEEVPRNKKKSFNFDKLDDFELGGDFNKLPSFKIDMPDLDFSTPVTKDDEPTEKHTGKQETKHDKYSFNFDFNELDRFDLASSPVKADNKSSNHANSNASDCSSKPVQNLANSDPSTDAFKDTEIVKPLDTDSMATSRHDNLILIGSTKDSKDLKHSISHDLDQHDESHELQTPIGKQNSGVEENKDKTHSNECHKEQPQETCVTRTNAENTTQDFILQAVSGNCSSQENNLPCLVGPASSDAAKADSAREGDDSMRTVHSSQSRNSSPVNSYKECYPETSVKMSVVEVPNTSGDLQKQCKQNQNEVTRGNEVIRESGQTQSQIDIQNASFTGFSQNMTKRVNNTAGVKQNSGSRFITCPLQRDARAVNPKSLNEKVAAAIQLNSFNKSKNNGSPETSLATKKRLNFVNTNKLKTLNIHPMKENSKPKQNHEQGEFGKIGLSKSSNAEDSVKAISNILRSKSDDGQSDTSSFQHNISNLPKQTTTNTSLLVHNDIPGTASIRCPKAVSVERSKLTMSSYVPKSDITKETKHVRVFESSLKFPSNMTSKMESTALTEKSGSMNSCLKRKSPEESIADYDNVKPLKRPVESVNARELSGVSQKSEKIVDPVTENMGASHRHSYTEELASKDILNSESSKDTEVPRLIEKDGNAEKTKELDDTYPNKQSTIAEENKKEICGSEGHRDQSKGTCLTKANFQLKAFSLQQQFIPSDAAKCITPNAVSSHAHQKSSKIVSFESDSTVSKDANAFDNKLTITRKAQNPATTRDAKSAKFSEHVTEFPPKTASKMARSISEKAACFTARLKRKTIENSNDDAKNSDQLKHVMESAIGRMKLLVSPKPQRFVTTEEMETSHIENCAEVLNSCEDPELGGSTGIKVIAPMEKDENVRKAEVYTKQLDDMCDKMRKKQEEAKELLVRAIVNNSSLVMLNSPVFEEKIHSLQRFAAGLQSKKFY